MKVTQVVKYLYPVFGGMERVAEIISHALEEQGIEEHKIFFLKDKAHLAQIALDRNMVMVKPLFYFKSQPMSFLRASVALWKKLKATDVMIIHSPLPNLEIPLYLYSFLIKKRIICVMHADPKDTRWKQVKGILNSFYTAFFKRCEAVVFTNPLNAGQSQIPCKNKVVINNGVRIVPSAPRQLPAKVMYDILYVGSFRKYKGLNYLIDALTHIGNVRLQLVGNGELFEKMKSYAGEKLDASRIIFHGNLSDEQLDDIYQKSDVFVLPSIDGSEAFGLVQVEAMAKGLPVVNTNLDTAVKLVSLHDVSGVTVEPMDSPAIAKALKQILQPGVYERYSANAVDRARLFSADQMVKEYLQLIRNNS